MPFDLAAYLAGKDFNFNNCPMPEGSENGSADISIGGNFRSEGEITSEVGKATYWMPDHQTSSNGAIYAAWPHGPLAKLALATHPRKEMQDKTRNYTNIVVARCTSLVGGVQIRSHNEALLFGAENVNASYTGDKLEISGRWTTNGTLAGNYTLVRTN